MRKLPEGIAIDGAICFGRPRLADHRIPTDAIVSFFLGGAAVATIAAEYEIGTLAVEKALRFEYDLAKYPKRYAPHLRKARADCKRIWKGCQSRDDLSLAGRV